MSKKHEGFFIILAIAIFGTLLAQVVVGIGLSASYVAEANVAHKSMQAIRESPTLALLQRYHYWASAFLIIVSGYASVQALWTGVHRENQTRFFCVFACFLLSLAFQITGNILPFDRHGVQTAAIEASIVGRIPTIGPDLAGLVLSGKTVSTATLAIWYLAHRFVLPGLLTVTLICFVWTFRRNPVSEPNWSGSVALLLLPFFGCFFMDSPLGSAATSRDYSEFNALASWYVAPMHGLMVAFEDRAAGTGWIGAVGVPAGIIGVLVVMVLAKAEDSWFRVVLGTTALLFSTAVLGFARNVAPIVGTRDPLTENSRFSPQSDRQDKLLARYGRQVFNTRCSVCHGTDGQGASAGPRVDSVYTRHSDAEYFIKYIQSPKSIRPGSTMPAFPQLSGKELSALAEFLRFPPENVTKF
jgi:quinol-cytochrome oxidoreductase complex cytochrome b subunit/cytochrome c2